MFLLIFHNDVFFFDITKDEYFFLFCVHTRIHMVYSGPLWKDKFITSWEIWFWGKFLNVSILFEVKKKRRKKMNFLQFQIPLKLSFKFIFYFLNFFFLIWWRKSLKLIIINNKNFFNKKMSASHSNK